MLSSLLSQSMKSNKLFEIEFIIPSQVMNTVFENKLNNKDEKQF